MDQDRNVAVDGAWWGVPACVQDPNTPKCCSQSRRKTYEYPTIANRALRLTSTVCVVYHQALTLAASEPLAEVRAQRNHYRGNNIVQTVRAEWTVILGDWLRQFPQTTALLGEQHQTGSSIGPGAGHGTWTGGGFVCGRGAYPAQVRPLPGCCT